MAGKVAVANSKAAYAEFKAVFETARYRKLEMFGAKIQRPLWASTGTKNPSYSDVLYVESLIGPQSVNTMPPATLDAFRDHGNPASRIEEGVEESLEILVELPKHGIDLLKVTEELEKAGVEAFADAHRKIIEAVQRKRQ